MCIHNECHAFELASCEDKLSRRWYNKPNIGLLHICWRSGGCDNIYLQEIILTWWTIAAHGAWDSRTKYYRVVWTLHTHHTTAAAASMTILTFRSPTSTHFLFDDFYDYDYVDSSRDLHFQASEVPKTVVLHWPCVDLWFAKRISF